MIRCQQCDQPATIHITRVLVPRSRLVEFHLCEQHARDLLSNQPVDQSAAWTAHRYGSVPDRTICFDIESVMISEIGDQQVVYLREVGGERRFPIVIGLFEATSLDRKLKLKHIQLPRPLTHEAWASTIPALGGDVQDVFIHELQQHTYFAKIRILQSGRTVEIDVRPSDAVNMAVLCGVPIYVAEELANEVCTLEGLP